MARGEQTRPQARLQRFEHPWVIAVFLVVLLAASTGSFILGRAVEAPTLSAAKAASMPVDVYAPVSRRIVDSRESFAGVVTAGAVNQVMIGEQLSPAVVTRENLRPGDAYSAGGLLGVVSGEPFYGLAGPLPLYRDLGRGDNGDDVMALQRSLAAAGIAVRLTGMVDTATISAVRVLFKRDGFAMGDVIPVDQLISVSGTPTIVISAASVGDTLSSKSALVTLQTSPNVATFRADPVEASKLTTGEAMTIQVGAKEYKGAIQSIGAFNAGSDGSTPGRPVSVVTDDQQFQSVATRTSATILDSGVDAESLAVPLTAIRQDNSGDYVLVEHRGLGATTQARVNVTVTRSGSGWAAIESPTLHVGNRVLVS